MSDLKNLARDVVEGAGQRAALAAGQRALEDLTLSPEERARRDAESAAKRKSTMVKVAIGGVLVVVAGLSIMSLLAKLWLYAIGALVVLGLGAGGYFVAKPRLLAAKAKATAALQASRLEREAKEREAAVANAAAAKQKKLDDDLAALKRSVKDGGA